MFKGKVFTQALEQVPSTPAITLPLQEAAVSVSTSPETLPLPIALPTTSPQTLPFPTWIKKEDGVDIPTKEAIAWKKKSAQESYT